jgi:hypothetical protein
LDISAASISVVTVAGIRKAGDFLESFGYLQPILSNKTLNAAAMNDIVLTESPAGAEAFGWEGPQCSVKS